MHVWLHLKKRLRWFSGRPLELVITDRQAEHKGWCQGCRLAFRCHPIVHPRGTKLCTIDFRQKIFPSLRFEQLV